MGRAPCCDKMGLKKGPWSSEEDQILINYIQSHGHANWRALPKQAGLLRCGKSCRLRWTNYLRPDIKRGNFTPEEEQTIFQLHHLLGNRWSAIAARLPGRTDNEIKNVWHTHLKKRLPHNQQNLPSNRKHKVLSPVTTSSANNDNVPQSPPQCSMSISDTSTLTDTGNMEPNNENMFTNNIDMLTHINNNIETLDDDFWSEVLSADNSNQSCQLDSAAAYAAADDIHFPFALSPFTTDIVDAFNMDFWGDHQVLTELSSPQL